MPWANQPAVLLTLPATVDHSKKSEQEIILTTTQILGGIVNTLTVLFVTFSKLSPIYSFM